MKRISKRTKAKAKQLATATAIVAGSGTVSALVVDSILSRLMPNSPNFLAVGRVAAGLGLAAGAEAMGVREEITIGVAAGPALVTGIDMTTRLIGRGPYRPPVAGSLEGMGDTWSPRLL